MLESATNDVIYATNFSSNSNSGILLATFNVSDQSGDGKTEFNVSILHANGLESMKNKILISKYGTCTLHNASVYMTFHNDVIGQNNALNKHTKYFSPT